MNHPIRQSSHFFFKLLQLNSKQNLQLFNCHINTFKEWIQKILLTIYSIFHYIHLYFYQKNSRIKPKNFMYSLAERYPKWQSVKQIILALLKPP